MPTESACPFCKIVAGEIPATVVFETASALAFLDIGPLASGHTLLIPKFHIERISDMSAEAAAELTGCLPRLARAIQSTSGADGLNVLLNSGRVAGQVVDHVHFHLIPRGPDDGLGYRWNTGAYSEGEAAALQKRIRKLLESE